MTAGNEHLSPSCGTVRARLVTYTDGELLDAETIDITRHLETCESCGKAYREIMTVLRTAEQFPVQTEDITESVLTHIAAHEEVKAIGQSGRQRTHYEERREASYRTELIDIDALRRSVQGMLSPLESAPHEKQKPKSLPRQELITAEMLRQAMAVAASAAGGPDLLERVLLENGWATPAQIAAARAEADGVPFIDLSKHPAEPVAAHLLPAEMAHRLTALPVRKDGQNLYVAMQNPRDVAAVDEIRIKTRCLVRPMMAEPTALAAALDETYPIDTPDAAERSASGAEEMRLLLDEVRALRSELSEVRGEMDTLRRQMTALRATSRFPPRPQSPLLFPGSPTADVMGRD